MTVKMTYKDQLQHPNWQRKRLEALNHYGFECRECGAADSMLHVHHRQYVKGRMAWEYSVVELNVLCESCHKAEHALLDELRDILMEMSPRDAVSLLRGFRSVDAALECHPNPVPSFEQIEPQLWAAGVLAGLAYMANPRLMLEVGERLAEVPDSAPDWVKENSGKGVAWRCLRPTFENLA